MLWALSFCLISSCTPRPLLCLTWLSPPFAPSLADNSNVEHQNEVSTLTLKDSAEALLREYRVAGLWAGHVHAYERTHPAFAERREDCLGTTYITIGDGGNREGLYDTWSDPPEEWVAFRNGSAYGRGDLYVVNATHIRWQWWPVTFAAPQDEHWITNPLYRTLSADGECINDLAEGHTDTGDDIAPGLSAMAKMWLGLAGVAILLIVAILSVIACRRETLVSQHKAGTASSFKYDDEAEVSAARGRFTFPAAEKLEETESPLTCGPAIELA